MYAYAAYAISRGDIPYRNIQLAQPLLVYLILAFLINLVGTNLLSLHLVKSTIITLTAILVYLTAKKSTPPNTHSTIPLLSTAIYGFITFIYFYTTFLEIFLTFSLLLCTAIYATFGLNNQKPHKPLTFFLIGILFGLSFMTKYISLIFSITLFLHNSLRLIIKKKYKQAFIDCAMMTIGAAIPVLISLAIITFTWNSFQQFFIQTIYWQMVRWPMPLSQRITNLSTYTARFAPLLIMTALGLILNNKTATSTPHHLFFTAIFTSNVIALTCFFNTFFLHYLYYLSPFLAILSAYGFVKTWKFITNKTGQPKQKNKQKLALIFLLTIVTTLAIELTTQCIYFLNFPNDNTPNKIAQYVSQITGPNEKIWTSEGAIAFFAQRLIVAANSSDWPIHSAFSDIFAYDFDTYMGESMKDYKNGVVSPKEFIESWEANKIKVIIIIKGKGWVPYPDELLWTGFQNHSGVSNYVQENYLLKETIPSSNSQYTYEIWVRK
jgi:hypothetical protein